MCIVFVIEIIVLLAFSYWHVAVVFRFSVVFGLGGGVDFFVFVRLLFFGGCCFLGGLWFSGSAWPWGAGVDKALMLLTIFPFGLCGAPDRGGAPGKLGYPKGPGPTQAQKALGPHRPLGTQVPQP